MHFAQFERAAEAAIARRGLFERHGVDAERLEAPTELGGLALVHARADAAGICKLALAVIREQQRAEILAAAFGIGPADNDEVLPGEAF
jgi:hypothetical protein